MQTLINVDVDDLAKAETFYRDAFGLRRGRQLGEGALEMLGGSSPVYLLLKPPGTLPFPDASSKRDYRRHWTPVHLDFVVDDLESALARAIGAGAVLQADVSDFPWGRLAQLADPFGHGICIIQFLGEGYDAIPEPKKRGSSR